MVEGIRFVQRGLWRGVIRTIMPTRTRGGDDAFWFTCSVSREDPENHGLEWDFEVKIKVRLPKGMTEEEYYADKVWWVWGNIRCSSGIADTVERTGWEIEPSFLQGLCDRRVYLKVEDTYSGSFLTPQTWVNQRRQSRRSKSKKRELQPLLDRLAAKMSPQGQRAETAREMWNKKKI